MPPVVAKDRKRFLRLTNFFTPYPQFVLRLMERARVPVRIREAVIKDAANEQDFPLKRYAVQVYAPLVNGATPDWFESTVLKYAKNFVASIRRGEDPEQAAEAERAQLEQLFDIAKANEKAEQEQVPKDVAAELEHSELFGVWKKIRAEYFPEREDLDHYRVTWSKRNQTSNLASCNAQKRRVVVARAMELKECLPYLEPLLYHEMCHAYLGPPKRTRGRNVYHGPDFKALEIKHPKIKELNHWIKSGGWGSAVKQVAIQDAG